MSTGEFSDILVAIHGIGEQSRNTTVRAVATRLAHSAQPDELPPLSPQPLGWFHTDVRGAVRVAPMDRLAAGHSLAQIGFTEVFWADIPQEVVEEGRTLEETKAWARTVVARARAFCKQRVREEEARPAQERASIVEPDFSLAAEVIDEMIEAITVLQNLTLLAEKAGIMRFDLDRVLEEYLGDVQIVTEFKMFRYDIIGRFHSAMHQIHHENPEANLHIVAHSEGTVVSFLGLLHALSGVRLHPATAYRAARPQKLSGVPDWLTKVRGYLTIGSPIDKHILLWPNLFEQFDFAPACSYFANAPRIKWRNYYDYGDPVGFKLETARRWLEQRECIPFEFSEAHDIGFARYVLPGKAHNDYWDDGAVFNHFIRDVIMQRPNEPAPKPATRPLVYVLSPMIPYLISFALLVAGTFILYRAVTAYTHPDLDPLQRYVRFNVLGLSENKAVSSGRMSWHALEIGGFIAGMTLLARLPRLATGWRWSIYGFIAFLLGCAAYWRVGVKSRSEIGHLFTHFGPLGPTVGVLVLGFVVAMISLLLVKIPSHEFGRPGATPRKQRWIFKGMRPLLIAGGLAVALLIGAQLVPNSALTQQEREELARHAPLYKQRVLAPDEPASWIDRAHLNREELNMLFYANPGEPNYDPKHVKDITDLLLIHPPMWPVLLSGAAFLYLWWLAALIFDLAFVWHRYVRHSVATDLLQQWRGYQPAATAR